MSPAQVKALTRLLRLKTVAREGWKRHSIPPDRVESVADHSYGVVLLSWLLCPIELDRERVLELALIHDLPEVETGDLTPYSPLSAEQKSRREMDALQQLTDSFAKGIDSMKLLREYQHQETPEARWVKAMDKLEMTLQSLIYEEDFPQDLAEFRESAAPQLRELGLEFLVDRPGTC
jgi:5'-deoxynucleotidase YfbR-like HD superfamily hydrolase